MMSGYNKEFKIYKPKKNLDGTAIQFSFNKEKGAIFATFANQINGQDKNGNYIFDWDNKGVFKLGLNDVGEMLSVLHDRQNGVGPIRDSKHAGLFHKSQTGNSILYFTKGRNTGFFIMLSVHKDENKNKYKCNITNSECEVLCTILKQAINKIFGW